MVCRAMEEFGFEDDGETRDVRADSSDPRSVSSSFRGFLLRSFTSFYMDVMIIPSLILFRSRIGTPEQL